MYMDNQQAAPKREPIKENPIDPATVPPAENAAAAATPAQATGAPTTTPPAPVEVAEEVKPAVGVATVAENSSQADSTNTVETFENPQQVAESIKPSGRGSSPKVGVILGAVISLFLVVFGGLFGFGVLVAYGQIEVPSEKLQAVIQNAIFRLPFMPKTPMYVLQAMISAHEEVASAHVEASLATQSESISDIIGTQDLDLAISGDVDVTDSDNPIASLNFKLSTDFDADLIVLDSALYARVNKLPQELTGMFLGLGGEDASLDPLMNKWVWFDTSELDTEAREALEENVSEEEIDEEFEMLFDRVVDEVLVKDLRITSDEVEGDAVHKLELELDGSDIDAITRISYLHFNTSL